MISNDELKKQVNAFYRDVIGLYEKRFDNNIKAFYNIRANEERIENEITEIEKKMKEINNKEGNHINNDKTFNLTPDAFLSYDRLEKKLEYKNEELSVLKKNNEEEIQKIIQRSKDILDNLGKYEREKMKIIAVINNRDFVDVLREANAQRQIYEERKKQNDEIFGRPVWYFRHWYASVDEWKNPCRGHAGRH